MDLFCKPLIAKDNVIKEMIKNWIIVYCSSRDLIGLAAIAYEPLYHAGEIETIN